MPAPTVVFDVYDAVFRYLNTNGHDDQELCQRLNVRSKQDFGSRGRIPIGLYEQALIAAEDITQDSALGFHVGCSANPSSIGIFYFLSIAAENVQKIIESATRFFPLAFDFINLELTTDEESLRIVLNYNDGRRPHRHVIENLMAHWYTVANKLTFDVQNVPRTLYLQHAQVCDDAVVSAIFNPAPVLFGQQQDRFDLKLENLQYHTGQSNRRLFSLSEKRARNLLLQLRSQDRFTRDISTHVIALLPEGLPGIEDVAQKMQCSGRTLQRRLSERNLSYQMLLDHVRKDVAIELLTTTKIPIAHIAERTGFADDSTFHRAFKRWTGSSPGSYRRR